MGKNKTIHSGDRSMILRVLKYFEEEKRKGDFVIPVNQAIKRTTAATGVSKRTIMRIKNEEKKIVQAAQSSPTPTSSGVKLPTPGKKRCQPPHNKLEIDDSTILALRNIIHSFYTVKKEVPTLKQILSIAKTDLNFPGQRETLRKILTEKLGYTFKKCLKKRDLLIERPEIK